MDRRMKSLFEENSKSAEKNASGPNTESQDGSHRKEFCAFSILCASIEFLS